MSVPAARRAPAAGTLFLAMAISFSSFPPAFAAEPPAASSDYILQMARVDLLIRKRQFVQAADELGRVPKEHQEDPLFQKYTEKVTSALYTPKERAAAAPGGGGVCPAEHGDGAAARDAAQAGR